MKKLVLISIILSLILSANQKVDISKNIIQLGLFKDEKNIQKLKDKFKDYQIYIKVYPNKLKKVFIVNIQNSQLEKTLHKIKKSIPNAFLIQNEKKALLFKTFKKNDWMTEKLSSDLNNSKLDSKAIIKTRNKFFE